jgi:hypothetical protein
VLVKLQPDYPVKTLCAVLALPRRSWYYQTQATAETDLQQAVEKVVAQYPTYGARRVQHQLRRDTVAFKTIDRKRVRRVRQELGLQVRRKAAKKRTTNSEHPYPRDTNLVKELPVTRPEEVWVGDITYIKLGDGTFVYLAILLDVYTRILRGWALSRSLGAELALAALHRVAHGTPTIHHSDQGVPYAAHDTDAVINSGNLGGPMFNLSGEVVGIVSQILTMSGGFQGIGFAATSKMTRQLLLDQKMFWSGVEGMVIEGDLARALNLPQAAGLLVQRVAQGSPAWRGGIRAGAIRVQIEGERLLLGGDIILEVNGIAVEEGDRSFDQIDAVTSKLKAGEMLKSKVLREGKVIKLCTTITQ